MIMNSTSKSKLNKRREDEFVSFKSRSTRRRRERERDEPKHGKEKGRDCSGRPFIDGIELLALYGIVVLPNNSLEEEFELELR